MQDARRPPLERVVDRTGEWARELFFLMFRTIQSIDVMQDSPPLPSNSGVGRASAQFFSYRKECVRIHEETVIHPV